MGFLCGFTITQATAMQQTISQLDDSYWQYHSHDFDTQHKAFLERHAKPGEYEVAGLTFRCPPNIYHPNEFGSTRFMLRGLFSNPRWGNRVLEIGTGCGAIGICLAAAGHDATLLDIDPVAVECARSNAALNNVTVSVHQSDLFAAIGKERYDLIIFNIPLMDRPIEDPLERISCDHQGKLFLRFMDEAQHHLAPGGHVCVQVANMGNRQAILQGLSRYEHSIEYAEFYAVTNEWRWIVVAQPLQQ